MRNASSLPLSTSASLAAFAAAPSLLSGVNVPVAPEPAARRIPSSGVTVYGIKGSYRPPTRTLSALGPMTAILFTLLEREKRRIILQQNDRLLDDLAREFFVCRQCPRFWLVFASNAGVWRFTRGVQQTQANDGVQSAPQCIINVCLCQLPVIVAFSIRIEVRLAQRSPTCGWANTASVHGHEANARNMPRTVDCCKHFMPDSLSAADELERRRSPSAEDSLLGHMSSARGSLHGRSLFRSFRPRGFCY